ncbi:MAG: hypothetical protein AAF747_10955, partial [Planctomycetota bacterium]
MYTESVDEKLGSTPAQIVANHKVSTADNASVPRHAHLAANRTLHNNARPAFNLAVCRVGSVACVTLPTSDPPQAPRLLPIAHSP